MPDREKVIRCLEVCRSLGKTCADCPYNGDCTTALCDDVLAILKEQEADMIALKNAYKELAEKGSVIVRCKDCIYGEHEKNESTGMEWIYCAHHRENRPNEWFCASGLPTIKQEGRKME